MKLRLFDFGVFWWQLGQIRTIDGAEERRERPRIALDMKVELVRSAEHGPLRGVDERPLGSADGEGFGAGQRNDKVWYLGSVKPLYVAR